MSYLYISIIILFHSIIYFGNKYTYSINWPLKSLSNHESVLTQSLDSNLSETNGKSPNVLNYYLYNGSKANLNKNNPPEPIPNTNPSEDISSHHVKVVTVDETDRSKTNENDSSKYSIEEHPLSFYYKFNSGTKCIEIKYKEDTVWRHTKEFEEEYPRELFFQRKEKNVTLKFYNFNLVYQYSDGQWRFHSRTDLNQITPRSLKIITLDNMTGNNLKTNDDSQYYLTGDSYVYYYQFLDGAKCVEVKYEGNPLWKYDASNSAKDSKNYPESVCYLLDLKMVFVGFKHSLKLYRCGETKCKFVYDINLDEFNPSNLKMEFKDNNASKVIENEPNDFEVKHLGFLKEYTFKNNSKCVEIIYDNKTIWKYNNKESENRYPNKLFFNMCGKMLLVDFSKFYLVYEYDSKKCELLSKTNLDEFNEQHFKFLVMESSGFEILDNSKYNIVSNPYNYSYVYYFKDNPKISEIKYNNATLWKYDSSKHQQVYPRSVYVNYDTKMLVVESPFYFSVYVYIDRWKIIFEDVNKDNTTEGTIAGEDEGTTPSVVTDVTPSKPKEGDKGTTPSVVTDDKDTTEVTADTDKDGKDVNKFKSIVNKLESYLHKMRHLMEYTNKGENKISNNLVQIVTLDNVDGNNINLKFNDSGKYTVDLVGPNKVHYKFNSGTKCVEIKYKEDTVWKYDSKEYDGNYPTELQIDMDEGHIVVFSGYDWHLDYKFVDKKFELEYYRKRLARTEYPPEIKILTIKENDSWNQSADKNGGAGVREMGYDGYIVNKYYRKGKPVEYAYEFKDNIKCVEIKYNNNSVWKYDNNINDSNKNKHDGEMENDKVKQEKGKGGKERKSENKDNYGNKYPVNVTYIKDTNVFVLIYDNEVVSYKKLGDKWIIDKEEFAEESKELRPKTQYVLDDALVLILMISGFSLVIVLLVLLLAFGFMYLVNKRTKLKMEVQQGRSGSQVI